MTTFPELLSLNEVAAVLHEPINTVRQRATRQVATGKGLGVPVVQPTGSGGRRYVRECDLARMLNTDAGAEHVSPAQHAHILRRLEDELLAAEVPPHYLSRSVYQPVTRSGLATRINEMYENRLYKRTGAAGLVWLDDSGIPAGIIREALQSAGADRVLALMQGAEATLAAARHTRESLPVGEPLRGRSQAITFVEAERVYSDAARQVMKDLDRGLLGREISENF